MRHLHFFALVLMFCLSCRNGSADARQNIADEKSVTVKLYVQESLDFHGKQIPDSEGMRQFFQFFERESGLIFEIHPLPWNRAKLLALNGKGIIWGFSRSLERMQNYHFSDSVLQSKIWAIAFAEPRIQLRKIDDLKGMVVSVERGVSHGLEFEVARNTVFRVDEDAAVPAARFKKLLAGRSDVLLWGVVQFEQEDKLLEYLHTSYLPKFKDAALLNKRFYVSPQPLFYDSIHFASAKNAFLPEIEKINLAIRRGIKNGELKKILHALE